MIYYKKCICGIFTRTDYEPGCPVHDPNMSYKSYIKVLEEENAKLREEINNMRDISWFERKMEKLGSTHAFKDERIRCLEEENAILQEENKEMIDAAGEALGTDPELRGPSCVIALVNHVAWMREELKELDESITKLKNEDAAKDDRMLDMEGRYKKELDTFREVLRKISEWGCNGQCVELIKTKCPCCIATEFLGKMEETNVKSTD